MKETEDRRPETEEKKEPSWSTREFIVSPKTDVSCAIYQTIVDFKGVALLMTEFYSDRESSGVKLKHERIAWLIKKMNEDEIKL